MIPRLSDVTVTVFTIYHYKKSFAADAEITTIENEHESDTHVKIMQ